VLVMLAMAVNVLALGTVTALFLGATTRGQLPTVYALGAAFGALASALTAALASRVPRVVEVVGCFSLLSLCLFVGSWLLPVAARPVLFVLHPVATGLAALGVVQAYALVNDCLDAEQAKRLLPAIAAGGTVGAMAAGGGLAWLAPRFGAARLLPAAAVLCAGAALVSVWFLARHGAQLGSVRTPAHGSRTPSDRPADTTALVRDLLRSRLLRGFAATQMLVAGASTLLKFNLESSLQAQLGVDRIAAFLGVLNLAANATALCVQSFAEARLLRRYGLMLGLLATAAVLSAGASLLLITSGLWVVASVRFAESVARFSVTRTAEDLVLLPLPSSMRRRAKTLITSALAPLAVLLSSLAIIALGASRRAPTSALMLVLGCVGVLAALSLRSRYLEQLRRSLKRRRLTLDPATRLSETAVIAGLIAGLPASSGTERLLLLRALARQRLAGSAVVASLAQLTRELQVELCCGQLVRLLRAALERAQRSPLQRRIVTSELDYHAQHVEEALFLLLMLVYAPQDMLRAQLSYARGERRVRAFALEVLAQSLDAAPRDLLLPYLSSLPQDEQLQQAERALRLSVHDATRAPMPGRLRPLALYLGLEKPATDDEESLMPSLEEVLILRTVELFSRLSPEELQSIADIAEPRHVTAGEVVFREGDPGDAFYVVLHGELAVSRAGAAVATLRDGECFGELALLDRGLRSATVSARTACQLSRIADEDFRELLERYPSIAMAMLAILARRNAGLLEKSVTA
ncbi:MAG TPA: cyclic nucleotide-binding domain-containing protein, partial [Polyangiales bacterium]